MEASPEEIEASQEKEELLEPKSDYYLYPLLTSHEQHRYDSLPSGIKNNNMFSPKSLTVHACIFCKATFSLDIIV